MIYVLDLGLLIPAVLITARWLQQDKPWGFVLAGVLLVKVTSISLAVLDIIAWMMTHGEPVTGGEIAVFGLVTTMSIAVGVLYFRSLRPTEVGFRDGEQPRVTSG